LNNAIKFTPNGTITISAEEKIDKNNNKKWVITSQSSEPP
jgi:signal transduction histidine kinase